MADKPAESGHHSKPAEQPAAPQSAEPKKDEVKKDGEQKKEESFFSDNKITLIGLGIAGLFAIGGAGVLSLLVLAAAFFLGGANDKNGFLQNKFDMFKDKKPADTPNSPSQAAGENVGTAQVNNPAPQQAATEAAKDIVNASTPDAAMKNATIIIGKDGKVVTNMQPDALVMEVSNSGRVVNYTVLDGDGKWPLDNAGKVKFLNSAGQLNVYGTNINLGEENSKKVIADLRNNWESKNSVFGSITSAISSLFTTENVGNSAGSIKVSELPAALEVVSQKIDVSNGFLLVKRSDDSGKNTVNDLQIILNRNTGEVISFNTADEKGNFIAGNERRFTSDKGNLLLSISHEDGKTFINTSDDKNREVFAKLKSSSENIKTSMIKPEKSNDIDGFNHGITINLAGLGSNSLSAG